MIRDNYDAVDSLIHLHKALGLDALRQELGERFGYEDENEDVAELTSWIESMEQAIKDEMLKHYDGRRAYSTGVPFMRCYEYPTHEPRGDGTEALVRSEAWVSMHPSGTPEEPYDKRGAWKSDAA
ncbi:hypothetical protein ACT3S7_06275 [Corynebacterium sp. AOP34-AQ2-28]|uniref:hypothetical protein n=1 Tax=Corynebacterium sp. AOP34-AQ2-28 TaxID=3457689 RepID=UPI0040336B5C